MAPNGLVLVCVVLVLAALSEGKQLPKFITKCKRNDPKLGECIKAQVIKLQPRLIKGIPELQLPPYDPIQIPQLRLEQGNRAVKFLADFKNITTYGASKLRIDEIKINLENFRMDIKLNFPKLRISSKYELNGKVLLLPVKGTGNSDGNFTNVDVHAILSGSEIVKEGLKYVNLTNYKVHLTTGGASLYFDNFFNGNKELTESTNQFINENWKDVVAELQPVLEEAIATLVYQLIKHLFENYPLDEILPP